MNRNFCLLCVVFINNVNLKKLFTQKYQEFRSQFEEKEKEKEEEQSAKNR